MPEARQTLGTVCEHRTGVRDVIGVAMLRRAVAIDKLREERRRADLNMMTVRMKW